MVKIDDISKYFVLEDLHSKKRKNHEDEEENSQEWFIDEGPVEEDIRTVFVRSGRDEDIVSKAS